MNEQQLSPYLFPLFFIGMWLIITTILGFASGWFRLQDRYPRKDERPLLKLRGRSGSMGMGVGFSGILTLGACRSGLELGIWKIFAPFQRPIFVPWKDIRAAPSRSLFAPAVQLSFGIPEMGRLKIDARSWERLRNAAAESSAQNLPPATPRVTNGATAKAMLLQWAVITLGAGCFFYFAPRLQGVTTNIPAAVCFGFPAIIFGFGIVVRFLRQA
jgi:hypothetical protein